MNDYLYDVITELLHVEEGQTNKLIDLEARDISKTYYLKSDEYPLLGETMLSIIKEKIGRPGNTVLRNSSLETSVEQIVGGSLSVFDWVSADGSHDSKGLHEFIEKIYKELSIKGNNPLFLSVGALKWKTVIANSGGTPLTKTIITPTLIFPIKLIRSASTTPIAIEFVNDDAYFNPCLIEKLNRNLLPGFGSRFPNPNGENQDIDMPISLERLGNGSAYFKRVIEFVNSCKNPNQPDSVFEFDPNVVAISTYNHGEICMYYDIKRNKEKMLENPLIKRMFGQDDAPINKVQIRHSADFVLPYDSVQEKMIQAAVNGESMVIKGPPGTGKTLTIANMISALLSSGKKVLVSSKKLAALSEVYAKVPERLRPYLLLLDSESEAQAAKINPTTIKKELISIISKRKTFAFNDSTLIDRQHQDEERNRAILELEEHYKDVFYDKDIIGGNYYEALDIYFKDDKIPEYPFDALTCRRLPREEYVRYLSLVEEVASHYNVLTNNDSHSIYKNPWYGVNPNINADIAQQRYISMVDNIAPILSLFNENILSKYNSSLKEVDLMTLIWIIKGELTKEQIDYLLTKQELFDNAENIKKLLLDLSLDKEVDKYEDLIPNIASKAIDTYDSLLKMNIPEEMTKKEIKSLLDGIELFEHDNSNFLNPEHIRTLFDLKDAYDKTIEDAEKHLFEATSIFDQNKVSEILENINKYHETLCGYLNDDKSKEPKLFDFAAKTSYKKLKEYCYLDGTTFKEIVVAINELKLHKDLKNGQQKILNDVQRIFQCKMTEIELEALFVALKYSKEYQGGIKKLVEIICLYGDKVNSIASEIIPTGNWSYKIVKNIYLTASKYQQLFNLIKKFDSNEIKFEINNVKDLLSTTQTIIAFDSLKNVLSEGNDIYTIINELKEFNAKYDYLTAFKNFVIDLVNFGSDCYKNYYTEKLESITINDLDIFVVEAKDRSMIGDALKYMTLVNEDYELPIKEFFVSLSTTNLKKGYDFKTIFEHSVYSAAIKQKISELGNRRYDVGKNMIANFKRYSEADANVRKFNEMIIEAKLMRQIDPTDRMFDFLQAEKDNSTLRKLFKLHGEAILKLKRCMILSPSTISLLFTSEELSNFDVAIIDEASQLEPVTILPILHRTKQCIVVGDEWQMPPMVHFKAKFQKTIDDMDASLEPDISALSLMLKNAAFNIHELECHYRSKTESLIRFSQKSFYPKMKTFPAPLPKRESLGFKDVYIEDATCHSGENVKEAEAVLRELREHFEKFFRNNKLEESVGIVTFGEKQKSLIDKMIQKDRVLSQQISFARMNKDIDDTDEKVFFLKTIEEVQGQEANHLILSMTYGVDDKGKKVNRFGQLNRDKLGQCIFNVAVTRAKYSITLIHSIHSYDIDTSTESGKRIEYLKNYIEIAELFSLNGKNQFLGVEPNDGFIKQVGEYLISLGVNKERIVYDYGVTEGSIRIPIAILSKDLQKAEFGIFLEKDIKNTYNYLDYNVRYYNILQNQCFWNLERVFIHDWYDNPEFVKKQLSNIVSKIGM